MPIKPTKPALTCLGTGILSVLVFPLSIIGVATGLYAGVLIVQGIRRRTISSRSVLGSGLALATGIAFSVLGIWIPLSGFLEARVRVKVSEARKRLKAAESQLLSRAPAPPYEPLQPLRLGSDPFARSAPVRVAITPDGSYRLWSVGPDRTDQAGTLLYDPTNGTVSAGDVVQSGRLREGDK